MAFVGRPRLLRNQALTVTAMISAVAIDVDHIPVYAGVRGNSYGARPFTHSLATVVVFGILALLVPRARRVLLGVAVGVFLHLFRDIASSPGILLWWPTSWRSVHLPYRFYAVMLVILGVIATARILRRAEIFRPTR